MASVRSGIGENMEDRYLYKAKRVDNMTEIAIKCCPFCGKPPKLSHEIFICKGDRGTTPSHELEIAWKIKCWNCGTSRESTGRSYYVIDELGELKLVPQSYSNKDMEQIADKRLEVIKMWNRRY